MQKVDCWHWRRRLVTGEQMASVRVVFRRSHCHICVDESRLELPVNCHSRRYFKRLTALNPRIMNMRLSAHTPTDTRARARTHNDQFCLNLRVATASKLWKFNSARGNEWIQICKSCNRRIHNIRRQFALEVSIENYLRYKLMMNDVRQKNIELLQRPIAAWQKNVNNVDRRIFSCHVQYRLVDWHNTRDTI